MVLAGAILSCRNCENLSSHYIHFTFQPINLISGSSYEQVQSKDSKFNGEKMSTGLVRKGIQAHPDGKYLRNCPKILNI